MAMAAMRRQGNYLRVRGEYSPKASSTWPQSELPPRARRIQVVENRNQHHIGTTSACAENTARRLLARGPNRNYLRVRGEYRLWKTATNITSELPPRARRILFASLFEKFLPGTTSACAENTTRAPKKLVCAGNYLRVRGEYWS